MTKKLSVYGITYELVNFVKNELQSGEPSAKVIINKAKDSGFFDIDFEENGIHIIDISDLIYHLGPDNFNRK